MNAMNVPEGSVTVTASMVGFQSSSQNVDSSGTVNFELEDGTFLDEVVVSASRTPQRIFESPVTIERFGVKEIANTAVFLASDEAGYITGQTITVDGGRIIN